MNRRLTTTELEHVLDVLREQLASEVTDSYGLPGTRAAAAKRAALERAVDKLSHPLALTPAEVQSIYAAQARLGVEWGEEGEDSTESRRTWRAFDSASTKALRALR